MSSHERRLIRKQINLKFHNMSNKEAQERDFLNSSQMITERQHMYMVITKHFREKDNLKTSKKQFPFQIENTSLPHVNIGCINRLFHITKKITKNAEEMDKIIKVHSYRTATPYYTNPELTLERGNFMNYSQHVGALLYTPRYIKFLKNLKGTDLSNDKQTSNNNSPKSSNSNTSRFYFESKSRSSSRSAESATISRKVSTSLSFSSSKSSLLNDKSESSFIKSPSTKSSRSAAISDKEMENDDEFESRNSSETTLHENPSLINYGNDSINEKRHFSKNRKISGDSSNLEGNDDEVNLDINKKLSPKCEDILNLNNNPNEDQDFSKTLLEKNSNNGSLDLIDNKNFKSKEEINRSLSSESKKNDLLNSEISSNMNESQENKINEIADFPDTGKEENSIIFESKTEIFPNTNVENQNFFKEIEEYFNSNEFQQDEIQPMRTYFETAVYFGNTKPDYVSDFYKFLVKQNQINFINFSMICNKYAIRNFTNDEVNKVKKLFNEFSKKSEVKKEKINEKQGMKDNSIEIKYESQNENVSNEGNDEIITNFVHETKSTKTKSPEIDKTLNNDLEIHDKNNLSDEYVDENEDFSESFNRLFRVSIPEISISDLIALKQMVNDYKDNIKPNTNTNLQKNSDKIDENNDIDFSESFHNLFRNSIGNIINDDIKLFQNVVSNTDEMDQELNSIENNHNSKNNSRSSIGKISQINLGNTQKAPGNHQNLFNKNENGENESSSQEDYFNEDSDSYLENRILMSFQSLFRNSIDNINEKDLEKINELIENHEREFIDN